MIVGIDKKKNPMQDRGQQLYRLICQQSPISKPKELRNIIANGRVQGTSRWRGSQKSSK